MDEEEKENLPVENEVEDDLLLEDDAEYTPPEEENEAKIVNTASIAGVILAVILVIFLIVFIAMNVGGSKKKTDSSSELDKAGTKTVIEFKNKTSVEYSENGSDFSEEKENLTSKEDIGIDEVLDSLPKEIRGPTQTEVGKAPVSSVGSSNHSYVSERPDTKNSKSPRKIEGLAALDYSGQQQGQNLVSQIMSGNYGTNAYGQRMSKEEFIAQQMAQTQSIQNQLYGSGSGLGGSSGATYNTGGQKENFFNASVGNAGSGQFLSKTSLWDGTIISGALITAINTDNPGVVMARVTENVYSSQDHSYLLIPEGSVLMATYNSSVAYGQNTVQVAWNLLIRPDNYRVQLGNMNGVNPNGASGYAGSVSNHPFETLKALGMVAVYSIIQTEVANDIKNEKNEYLQNAMTDVYAEAAKLGNKMVDRALDIKPTIKIKEGTEIKLITNTPLELPPVEVFQATQKYVRTRK